MSLEYEKKNISLAKNLRKNATRQENHLWYDYLSEYPLRFQRQKAIENYIADFYCHKAKLIIEIDGSQHFEPDYIKNDEKRTSDLEKLGVSVLRFNNSDIDKNFEGVCLTIDKTVKAKLK